MTKVKLLILVTCTASLSLFGCANQQQQEVIKQICIPQTTNAQAMKTAENILGQMHFSISKADIEKGYMRTKPLPSAQFFEFWRSDTVGIKNSTEANIHNIRRIAELNITPQKEQLCITCNVKVQRLSLSEPKGSNEALARDKFLSNKRLTMEKRMKLRIGQKTWIDLGNDEQLSTVILKRLEKKFTKKDKKI